MAGARPTRGFGLLEPFLARRRAARADALIPEELREGTIVDIGCGVPPSFLERTRFARKIGIDLRGGASPEGVTVLRHDVRAGDPLPVADATADVVTSLAMIEHLSESDALRMLEDARRVLRPGGMLVLTTPAPWAGPLLRALAALRVVSREEIDDHRSSFGRAGLSALLVRAGYGSGEIRSGRFQLGANVWATARRKLVDYP